MSGKQSRRIRSIVYGVIKEDYLQGAAYRMCELAKRAYSKIPAKKKPGFFPWLEDTTLTVHDQLLKEAVEK